jgi:hypothetical protein
VFSATLNIPTSSTAQVRLYDVTNHNTLWESTVISGPQTEYVASSTITPASGSSVLELWIATPTISGGNAICLSAVVIVTFS